MRLKQQLGLVLLAGALGAGCTDGGGAGTPLAPDAAPAGARGEAVQQLARGLAAAMDDAAVRSAVRDAMRASPYGRHKLIVQEFAATAGGRRVLAAAARASGLPEHQMQRLLAELPEMDLVVPFREQRTGWRGENDVAVLGALEPALSLSGYAHDGRRVTYAAQEFAPRHTVFLLLPTESRGKRLEPQANVPGAVIQERGEGETAVYAAVVQGDREIEVDPRDLRGIGTAASRLGLPWGGGSTLSDGYCPPDTEDCGNSGVPPVAERATWLQRVNVQWWDPDGEDRPESWGTMEIEFKSRLYDAANTLLAGEYKIRFEGMEAHKEYRPQFVMAPISPNDALGRRVRVEVVETDWLDDDLFDAGWLTEADHGFEWKAFKRDFTSLAGSRDVGTVYAVVCFGSGAQNPCPITPGITGNPQVI